MDRRKFLDVVARGGAAAAAWATSSLTRSGNLLGASGGSPRPALPSSLASSAATPRKLIIPSDTPDRFKAKVMEFNPIPAPDPATWELQIGGMVERPMKLKLADVKRLS